METNNNFIFALDIGTRTIVGLILDPAASGYEIIDSEIVEHENRAMLDGQIHNVREVARQVKKVKDILEDRQNFSLNKVALAAAGRALKTVAKEYSIEFSVSKNITEEDVQTLELAAVQRAQRELAQESSEKGPGDYHFVGYSVMEYKLEDMFIGDLIGQKGNKIEVKLIATFLPRVVIDSLLNVINKVDLEVEYLTLEPIAAASVVVPREMYNFNLALIDIGAGTSDIAVTKGGSMIGFGMVPEAGDEITEVLAEEYLLDYNTAEKLKRKIMVNNQELKVKNVLGKETSIKKEEVLKVIKPQVEKLTQLISEKILEINQKKPRALICIGGGSLTPFLKEKISNFLEIDQERIGIKGINSLDKIEGKIENINEVQSVTPVGIGKVSYESDTRAVFIRVQVNGNSLQIFSLEQPTVADALLTANIDIKQLQPRPGRGITCTVNGEMKSFKGSFGSSGKIMLNEKEAELDDLIEAGDEIEFESGEKGEDANPEIKDVLPEHSGLEKKIEINDKEIEVKPQIYQNGKQVTPSTPIKDGANIEFKYYEKVGVLVSEVLEIPLSELKNQKIDFSLNEEPKTFRKNRYLIKNKSNNNLIEWDQDIKTGMAVKVIKNDNYQGTVGNFLNKAGKLEEKITFNGSNLKVPLSDYELYCGEEEIDLDYKIKEGDKIYFETQPLSIKDILDYINYEISESMREKVNILVNGEISSLNKKVQAGDNLEIKYKNNL